MSVDPLMPITATRQWTLYQDEFVVDSKLANWLADEIDSGRIDRGATLVIAARHLRVDGAVVIPYCSLILVAEVLVAACARIHLQAVRSGDVAPRYGWNGAMAPTFVAYCLHVAGSLEVQAGGADAGGHSPGLRGALASGGVATLTEQDFWKAAHGLAPGWAEHRARVGEYLLRSSGRSTSPATAIDAAGYEFSAALKLDPNCERAQLRLSQLENAQLENAQLENAQTRDRGSMLAAAPDMHRART